MQLAHQFKRIKLNLARSKAFPVGSDLHGYEFVAPLDPHGHIDSKLWKEQREQCPVRWSCLSSRRIRIDRTRRRSPYLQGDVGRTGSVSLPPLRAKKLPS